MREEHELSNGLLVIWGPFDSFDEVHAVHGVLKTERGLVPRGTIEIDKRLFVAELTGPVEMTPEKTLNAVGALYRKIDDRDAKYLLGPGRTFATRGMLPAQKREFDYHGNKLTLWGPLREFRHPMIVNAMLNGERGRKDRVITEIEADLYLAELEQPDSTEEDVEDAVASVYVPDADAEAGYRFIGVEWKEGEA